MSFALGFHVILTVAWERFFLSIFLAWHSSMVPFLQPCPHPCCLSHLAINAVRKDNFCSTAYVQLGMNCCLYSHSKQTPIAARSKAWVCSRSLAGIAGSNSAGFMYVCLLRMLTCFAGRNPVRPADLSSKGVVPRARACVCACVQDCDQVQQKLSTPKTSGQKLKKERIVPSYKIK